MSKRKQHTPEFKAQVILSALREKHTLAELGAEFGVHPMLIAKWKRRAIDRMAHVFSNTDSGRDQAKQRAQMNSLFHEVGKLQVELDWLRHVVRRSAPAARALVDRDHPKLSISRQCELLGVSRASLYYRPLRSDGQEVLLQQLIKEQHQRAPTFGSRRMAAWLCAQGHAVGRRRVGRIMGQLGLLVGRTRPQPSAESGSRQVRLVA